MNTQHILTEDDYQAALREVTTLKDNPPPPGSPQANRFDSLVKQVEAYESMTPEAKRLRALEALTAQAQELNMGY